MAEGWQAFPDWAFCATAKGAGVAHSWCKHPRLFTGIASKGNATSGEYVSDPFGLIEHRRDFWSGLWQKGAGARGRLAALLGQIKLLAMEAVSQTDPITEGDLLTCFSMVKCKDTRWADGWTNNEMEAVPTGSEAARAGFVALLNPIEHSRDPFRWPLRLSVSRGRKPTVETGERHICSSVGSTSCGALFGAILTQLGGQTAGIQELRARRPCTWP